jgi:hypothetical protein
MGKIFYKFRKISKYSLDEIEKHYFYFSRPAELNDPYDAQISEEYSATNDDILKWGKSIGRIDLVDQMVNNQIVLKDKKFLEGMNIGVKSLEDRCHLLCLSEKWNSTQMWAHYADSRQGICFGYETSEKQFQGKDEYFIELEKSNVRSSFFIPGNSISQTKNCYFMVLVPVSYNRNAIKPYNPFKHNIEAIKEGFLSKSAKWDYENEYRCFMINCGDIKSFNNKLTFEKDILREVIIGDNIDPNSLQSLIEKISNNYDITKINFFKIVKTNDPDTFNREVYNVKIKRGTGAPRLTYGLRFGAKAPPGSVRLL